MALTPAQLQTLKTDIAANANVSGQPGSIYASTPIKNIPNNDDGNTAIAYFYNQPSTFVVYRRAIPLTEVGSAMLSADVANLTTANNARLQVLALYAPTGFNASADVEAGYNDIFSVAGAAGTRANLHVVWRRFATNGEKLYATGTGSDATPGTLVFQGSLTDGDVSTARNS
jgi:hypothetical protein